ncbi:DUF4189 domain-containing protein [Mycobacterium interjectum]|uniref:DUF4189 domain-containing protein n=1 Tax=Mycobacterium interjectum TaxID=33895 RepID=UPI00135B7E44|nr:DUF4189 domain-containing protein [Mycobacterium interjectum]MCV7090745.1 DUF4189 domain-containing protein [Mycobacterium interjectum]
MTKIGQGGQGVVYRAPNVKTKFAAAMVYKEYKTQTLTHIDFTALAAMPALVEDTLTYAQAERLISVAAWPCALVEDQGAPTGFVMPAIPDEFFIALATVKGTSDTAAEFQHLLNHPSVLAARGIEIDDAQRYTLLREVASGLAFLHKHGVCVGDISPKNLLFSLTPHEAVYFIDCDGMRINGVSALPQVETPGWDVPVGEELATVHTDTYKLGLLALRLLAGDHDTKNPQHLPPATPALLRQIITDTLRNQPETRPLPEAWTYVLGHAIEHSQHEKLGAATAATPISTPLDPPQIPVVHSRPTAKTSSSPPALISNAAPPTSPPPPWTNAASPARKARWPAILLIAAVAVFAVMVLIAKLAHKHTNNSGAIGPTNTSTYPSSAAASPSTYTPPPAAAPEPPPVTTTASPPDMYVVIVASSTRGWYGANNYSSFDDAKDSAMSRCRAREPDCTLVASSVNGCVALAWQRGIGYGASGSNRKEAEQNALGRASGGEILTSLCTG